MPPGPDQLPDGALGDAVRGRWVPVAGVSMLPILPEGSRVRALSSEPSAPAPGDLVLFQLHGALAVHRVIGLEAGRLLRTKGDGSLREEAERLPATDVLGIVVEAEREGETTDLRHPAWRRAGRRIAAWSRFWNACASVLPATLLNHHTLLLSRAARKALLVANRASPALADRRLRPLWRRPSQASSEGSDSF